MTNGGQTPLIASPYLKLSGEVNAVILMYARFRLPSMVGELVNSSSTTYCNGGKKDGNSDGTRKETDDDGDEGCFHLSLCHFP